MSYVTRETSDYGAHPLELYRFAVGNQLFLYTSADHVVVYGVDEYQPVYIKRGGMVKGGDIRKASLEIEVAGANPLALLFRTGWLPGIVTATVFRHHHGDIDFVVIWKGRVTACKWSDSVARLTCDNTSTLLQRPGLRRAYQVGCPHVLYGAACGVDSESVKVTTTAAAVVAGEVTITGLGSYGTGYFAGGMLEFGAEKRFIVKHVGDIVSLVDTIAGLADNAAVTLWPGCAHNVDACQNIFNNLDNYGGLPYRPSKNPFSGDALV